MKSIDITQRLVTGDLAKFKVPAWARLDGSRLSPPRRSSPLPRRGTTFGLEAREVVRADGEFAPRQGAALVAIERSELPGELHQTQFRGAHGAIERREVLGELRHKGRDFRLDDSDADVGRGTFAARA